MKEFFKNIASEEKKNIDYKLLSRQILTPLKKSFSFLQKHGNLYNFWINVLDHKSSDKVKLQQVEFLKVLMNWCKVYKKFEKSKEYNAGDLYLLLLRNQKYTVSDIFLNTPTDKHNEEICLQAKILFNLRERFFKELFNKGIIKSDSDQSDIEYEESIAERTKSRKQRFDKIKEKEQNINNKLFKKYFYHQSPSNIYNALSNPKNTKKHDIQVNLIKSGLID